MTETAITAETAKNRNGCVSALSGCIFQGGPNPVFQTLFFLLQQL